ncbi:EAL domain-containing protein [Vibrio sp. Of7-15]|uniref:EAL domain-containing protein n=1 Tax=Vibrio sp. Of7-15 TaxID=2724879 RepID=UPI001EF1E7CE|nr:EAL domain-containing protein [Vibrio sp. Of7-15]MCG7495542.1 EAL domain-containing protein [Vibrio sp. Of7-15]
MKSEKSNYFVTLKKELVVLAGAFLFTLSLVSLLHFNAERKEKNEHVQTMHAKLDSMLMRAKKQTIFPTNELTHNVESMCEKASEHIRPITAQDDQLRSIVLVKDQVAFCSPIIGVFSQDVRSTFPNLDLEKNISLILSSGTSVIPDKPVVLMWHKEAENLGAVWIFETAILQTLLQEVEFFLHVSIAFQNARLTADGVMPIEESSFGSGSELPFAIEWKVSVYDVVSDTLESFFFGITVLTLSIYILLLPARPVLSKKWMAFNLYWAMKNNQFYPVYQPVYKNDGETLYGVEVLLRWQHPTKGNISPNVFIEQAEKSDQIVELTRHLFGIVIEDCQRLPNHIPLTLNVNIASAHLHEGLLRDASDLLVKLPSYINLTLELTEREKITSSIHNKMIFQQLSNMGVTLAIDDFGTGYNSLELLSRNDMSIIKIDRSFVSDLVPNQPFPPLLHSIVELTKALNLTAVAEGIETEYQYKQLKHSGVELFQGFMFSKPLPINELVDLLSVQGKVNKAGQKVEMA